MNKDDSITSIFLFVIALIMIGIGEGNPLKSGLAALGCIIIICLGIYSVAKAEEKNFVTLESTT